MGMYDIKNVRKFVNVENMKNQNRVVSNALFSLFSFAGLFLGFFYIKTKLVISIDVISFFLLTMVVLAAVLRIKKIELKKYIYLFGGVCCLLSSLFCVSLMIVFFYYYLLQNSILFVLVILFFMVTNVLIVIMYANSIMKNWNSKIKVNPRVGILAGIFGTLGSVMGFVLARSLSQEGIILTMIILVGIVGYALGFAGLLSIYRHIMGKKYNII